MSFRFRIIELYIDASRNKEVDSCAIRDFAVERAVHLAGKLAAHVEFLDFAQQDSSYIHNTRGYCQSTDVTGYRVVDSNVKGDAIVGWASRFKNCGQKEIKATFKWHEEKKS